MKETPQMQFTPEQELLLWSIRVDHAKDHRIAEILITKIDWTYVRETAILHGIIPLLYKRLKEDMVNLVPPDELSELRTLFMANAVNNLRMTQQLIKVLDLLGEASVEAMPFKGPGLAVQAYGDLSMRSFCDLDILIHKDDLKKVCNILRATGHTPIFSNFRENDVLKLGKEIHFTHKNYGLDIHWDFAARFRMIHLNIDNIWKRKQSVSLYEREFSSLSLEDNLIISSVYLAMDRYTQLKAIADIIYLIQDHSVSLEYAQNEAARANVNRALNLGLHLAKITGGLHFINEIDEQMQNDVGGRKLVEEKIGLLFKHDDDFKENIKNKVWYVKSREKVKDRVMYIYYYITDIILHQKA